MWLRVPYLKITVLKLYDCRRGTRFPGSVKKVRVRVLGCDRVLSPLDQTWDSFFLADDADDVHIERDKQGIQNKREPFN